MERVKRRRPSSWPQRVRSLRRGIRTPQAAATVLYPLLQIGLFLLLRRSGDALILVVSLGVPLVIGAVISRWWAIALPALTVYAALSVQYLMNPDCQHPSCGGDEDWSNIPILVTIVEVIPLALAMAVGVALGKGRRWWRGRRSLRPK